MSLESILCMLSLDFTEINEVTVVYQRTLDNYFKSPNFWFIWIFEIQELNWTRGIPVHLCVWHVLERGQKMLWRGKWKTSIKIKVEHEKGEKICSLSRKYTSLVLFRTFYLHTGPFSICTLSGGLWSTLFLSILVFTTYFNCHSNKCKFV